MAKTRWVKKGAKSKGWRKTGKSRKLKKTVKAMIKVDSFNDSEKKFYYYQPVANGTINTTGLKYLLNAIPYSRGTVTAGVPDTNVPGTQGTGAMQVIGKSYYIKNLRVRIQLVNGANDIAQVFRVIILREQSPEGILFATGNALLYDAGAGLGTLSPVMLTNLLQKDNNGRFKIYMDKTIIIQNQGPSSSVSNMKEFIFSKTFINPIKVNLYDPVSTFTVATTAVVGNIQNNAFYAVVFCGTANGQVNQIYCGIDFYDA